MATPTLRALAKAYSDKLIDRKAYIRERRRLIDDIESGAAEIIPYSAPSARLEPNVERTFSDGGATFEIPPQPVEKPVEAAPVTPRKPRYGLLFMATVIATIAAFGLWQRAAEQRPVYSQHVDSIPPPASVPKTNPAEALLENFLDENQWRGDVINDFVVSWRNQPQSARDALADSPLMRRAGDTITQKFLEEKALLDLGGETDAMAAQRRLLDLAGALSISNDRIDRQEHEWQAQRDELIAGAELAADPVAAETGEPVDDGGAAMPAALDTSSEPAPAERDIPARDPGTAVAVEPAALPVAEDAVEPIAEAVVETDTATSEPSVSVAAAIEDSAPPVVAAPALAPAVAAPAMPSSVAAPEAARETLETAAVAEPAESKTQKSSGCRAEIARQRRPYCRDMLGPKLKGPPLVVLPAGEVEVGGRNPEEQPRHRVTIPRPFGIGVFEVSFEEFRSYCQATKRACPAQPWSDPKLPVVNVPWSMAMDYLQWLSEMSGATYRLPSESEWEYATRGGTTTAYPFGDEVLPTHARFSFRTPETTPLAATDRAVNRNKFRLYHTIGNVREWVLDEWHENHNSAPLDGSARTGNSNERVARGGAYSDGPDQVRSASRVHLAGDVGDPRTGFRVLREID